MMVYYAHCLALYGTAQEKRDVELLERLGFTVFNPNNQMVEGLVRDAKKNGDDVMEAVFKPLAQSAASLVFRALPDGSIPAGVAKEIDWALEAGVPVFELPSAVLSRVLSLEATREYLREVGYR